MLQERDNVDRRQKTESKVKSKPENKGSDRDCSRGVIETRPLDYICLTLPHMHNNPLFTT